VGVTVILMVDRSHRAAAAEHLKQLDRENDESDHEQDVDQSTGDVKEEAEKPEYEQDGQNGPQHHDRLQDRWHTP